MIGNWSEWKAVKWMGDGYRYERVRAYRSWFGFIREERERRVLPLVGKDGGIALLNGSSVVPGELHHERLREMQAELVLVQKNFDRIFKEKASAEENFHRALRAVSDLAAQCNDFERRNANQRETIARQQTLLEEGQERQEQLKRSIADLEKTIGQQSEKILDLTPKARGGRRGARRR